MSINSSEASVTSRITPRRIASVKNTPLKYPDSGLTESSIRWLIFNARDNGFDSCIVRLGRRVFIDLDKFEQWLDEQAAIGGGV